MDLAKRIRSGDFTDEDGLAAAPVAVRIVPSRFGLVHEPDARRQGGGELTLTGPAVPGDVIVIRGTGLGLATPEEIEVDIGGAVVRALSRTSVSPGLEDVAFEVPPEALKSCYAGIRVVIGGRASNIRSLPVSEAGKACVHPLGLSEQQLAILEDGGMVPFGGVELRSSEEQSGRVGDFAKVQVGMADRHTLHVNMRPVLTDEQEFGCQWAGAIFKRSAYFD